MLSSRTSVKAKSAKARASMSPHKRARRNRCLEDASATPPMHLTHKLPSELLIMVVGYLSPADLLNLARTEKLLRSFLLCKSRKMDWQNSLRNVEGLPPCPAWLSEPRYASLSFDTHCDQCLAEVGSGGTLWAMGVRYCEACVPAMLTTQDPLEKYQLEEDRFVRGFTACSTLPIAVLSINDGDKEIYYSLRDITALEAELHSTKAYIDKLFVLIHRRQTTRSRNEVAKQCRAWRDNLDREVQREIIRIKNQRRRTIMRRMEDLGFTSEVAGLGILHVGLTGRALEVMSLPQKLTDVEWIKVKPILTKALNERRPQQQKVDLRVAHRSRLSLLEDALKSFQAGEELPAILPHPVDLSRTAEVRTLVEAVLDGDASLSTSTFTHVLPRLIGHWRKDRNAELVGLLPYVSTISLDSTTLNSSPVKTRSRRSSPVLGHLDLACAVFLCSHCHAPLLPHAVFSHPCCYETDMTWHGTINDNQWLDGILPSIDGDVFDNSCLVHFRGRLPWTSLTLLPMDERVRSVVEACDEDPARTTPAALDRKNLRMACTACEVPGRSLLVMGWRSAIVHTLHHSACNTLWEPVSPAVQSKVLTLERNRGHHWEQHDACWECRHCEYPGPGRVRLVQRSRAAIATHVQLEHNIPVASEDDMQVAKDWMAVPPPVRIISSTWKDRLQELNTEEQHDIELERAVFLKFKGPSCR